MEERRVKVEVSCREVAVVVRAQGLALRDGVCRCKHRTAAVTGEDDDDDDARRKGIGRPEKKNDEVGNIAAATDVDADADDGSNIGTRSPLKLAHRVDKISEIFVAIDDEDW